MTLPFLPNEADATFNDQAEPDSVDFEILLLGFQQTGVVSGCEVTESSGSEMEIDVASGEVLLAGSGISVSAQADETIATADGTNPRVDLVTINSGGSVVVTTGTPAENASSPGIPANSVPLAFVYVPASDTTITDNQINNKRVFIVAGASGASTMYCLNHADEQTGTSTSAFPWKGSGTIPDFDIDIHELFFYGSITSGGTYQGGVVTISGGTVATIVKTAAHVAVGADAELLRGTLTLRFSTPISLTAGTTYYLMVGRTDQSDTFAVPVQFPAERHPWPFGAHPSPGSLRIAKAAPAVSDSVDETSVNTTVKIGVLWSYA